MYDLLFVDYGFPYKPIGRIAFSIDESTIIHERVAYGILNLFGDFGGVQYVLMLLGGYFVGGISEFNFTIKAI